MNNFAKQFQLGVTTWFESWGFIFRNGLAHYFLYPILISILLGMGATALIRQGVRWIMSLVEPNIQYTALPDDTFWHKVLDVLSNIGEYGIAFILWIVGLYAFSKINKYLTLGLMSPVMTVISEKTEHILTGKTYAFDGQQFVRDIVRGVSLAIRNLIVELFLSIIVVWGANLLLTILFPPLGVILSPLSVIVSFFIGAYFFGFSTMDYYNERKRLSYFESVQSIRKMKGIALGNGSLFALLFMVPFIGTAISIITCTVSATLAMYKEDQRIERK